MIVWNRRIVLMALAGSAPLAGALLAPGVIDGRARHTTTAAQQRPVADGAAAPAGWPNAANTGVPPGTSLRVVRRDLVIRRNGTVLNAVDVRGAIDVYANNVTIRNCRVTSRSWAAINLREGYTNLRVENCDIHGDGVHQMQYGVKNMGTGFIAVRRNDIHTCTNCVDSDVGLIEDNYVHDPKYFRGDHTDMIMCEGGAPDGKRLIIRHNTVINTLKQTGAIALFADFSPVRNVLVERNLLAGGGYALYGGSGGPYGRTSRNIVIRDNVFARRVWPKGGYWGPVTYFDVRAPGNVWRNNVWRNTGAPVRP